jgi:uncharacterized protein (TIGR03790 family)
MRIVASLMFVLLLSAAARAALTANELLLIANKNVPESVDLAVHYARVRNVPSKQIFQLDLPTTEAILPEAYEQRLAGPVRKFLASPDGASVRCLVLFRGVPLIRRPMESTEVERAEAKKVRQISDALVAPAGELATSLEKAIGKLGVSLPASPLGGDLGQQQRRILAAMQALQRWAAKESTPLQRAEAESIVREIEQQSRGAATRVLNGIEPQPPTTRPAVTNEELQRLADQPRDAGARATLRARVAERGGLFPLAGLLDQQYAWINTEESDAAVDSELALVRVPDFARYRWQPNPLNIHAPPNAPRTGIMTARIDGPTREIAQRLIDESIEVEKTGLSGVAVIDSRGIASPPGTPTGSYAWYDGALRDAAALLKAKSTLKVVTDDREQVLLPKTVENVAVYCGWYSLQNYIPGCVYVKGAVGFHVASLEMTSLRDPLSKEWVPNLLSAGVNGTLGAVGEPYLHAFPRPDEFFPLLLSGKFTLAEVYWKSVPMTSWKIALIGDPLYNPFAAKPVIKLEDTPLAGVR